MKLEELNLKQLKEIVKQNNIGIKYSKLKKEELIAQLRNYMKTTPHKSNKKIKGGAMSQDQINEWEKQYQKGFDNGKNHIFDGTLSVVQNVPKGKYDIESPQNKYYYDPFTMGQNDALKSTSTSASNLPDSIKKKWLADYNAGVNYANQTLGTDAKTIQEAPYLEYKPSDIHANWNGKSADVDDSQKYYFEPKSFGYNKQLTALKKNYNYHGPSAWESFKQGFEMPINLVKSIL
ncbi:MAG: hypothetical protein JSS98_18320 [Bacteroidetes bacterium]|nr:hypothetical protein [Bacteroidota bacterium]